MFYSGFDALFSILFPLVFLVAGNVHPLGYHSGRDGKARGRIIFAPCAQIAHHGKQDHAQHHQKHQHERYYLLCDLSGGKRRPHGT